MSKEEVFAKVLLMDEKHRRPATGVLMQYGTAGFRDSATLLDHVVFRVGLVAALRSKLKNSASIGVMITASHNPEEDNGVKLVDPMGEMLESSWEILATDLVNSTNLIESLDKLITSLPIDLKTLSKVTLGCDTRPSSPELVQALADGVNAFDGEIEDFGKITTPQLHYLIRCKNTGEKYGEYSTDGYYKKLSEAFIKIRGESNQSKKRYVPKLRFDGANGVGALAVRKLNLHLASSLHIEVYNDGTQAGNKLNYQCGADYVKVHQMLPEGILLDAGVRCCSFDGDGDRIIYFYISKMGEPRILDGDKIATLISKFIKDIIGKIGMKNVNFGLVQTAYANGSSTKYAEDSLKFPVICTATGVKHLHRRATEFDIGIYFEANGHGTVVFKDEIKDRIRSAAQDATLNEEQKESAVLMLNFIDLVNETVGDAISDMLIVETILHYFGWSIEDWDNVYLDLPNRLLKAQVPDRNVIKTDESERRCTSPEELQQAIDQLVSEYKEGRAFVRPSGTENVVRIYAEAAAQNEADQLAEEVALKVKLFTEKTS